MTAANDPLPNTPKDQRSGEIAPESAGGTITIQPTPPPPVSSTAAGKSIQAKPARPGLTPERLAAWIKRLDWLHVGLALVLAFFLGSFIAHNSDFWMHLATGKLIASGQYHFGSEPFAYTTQGLNWYNPTWLSDILLYKLAGAPEFGELPARDGEVLVIAKAVLATVVLGILLLIRRSGQSIWIPVLCAALALVTMSPRLTLRSMCISFLFLALTLYLLQRSSRLLQGRRGLSACWLLPPLCALWANLDGWFLLGPLAIGLYGLGEALEQSFAAPRTGDEAPPPGELRRLGLVFAASLVACLVNPHIFLAKGLQFSASAFLPPELWAALSDSPLRSDAAFRSFFFSPWQPAYFTNPAYGLNVAGLAYYLLVGLGVLSFALTWPSWRGWRLLVWLTLFLLSGWLAWMVPFFAVVAAPIAALNFQEFVRRRFGAAPRLDSPWRQWSAAGRILTALVGLALLIAAWPGWLYAGPDDPRRSRHVAWRVAVDPSLRRAAQALAGLYQQGILKEQDHGFNFTPSIGNYCAWFCPKEKDFYDFRFQLFPQTTAFAFVEVRRALNPPQVSADGEPERTSHDFDWQQLFRDHHINHVIVNTPDSESMRPTLEHLWLDQEQWHLFYMDGRTSIFGWKDPDRPKGAAGSFPTQPVDLVPLAFGPNPPASARAPDKGPEPPMEPDTWIDDLVHRLQHYWHGPALHSFEADQADMYLVYFRGVRTQTINFGPLGRRIGAWLALSASTNTGTGMASGPLAVFLQQRYSDIFLLEGQDLGPPAAPVLGVRSARRAVADSPENADGYLVLAEAYKDLWELQEQPWGPGANQLRELRQAQIVNALQHTLLLKPDQAGARQMLALMYEQLNYKDLALEQWNAWFNLVRSQGPRPGESQDRFQKRVDALGLALEQWEKQIDLKHRRTEYELAARNKPVSTKIELALYYGLAQQALDLLQSSDEPGQLGAFAPSIALYVFVRVGRVAQAKEFDFARSPWDHVLVAATLGDYPEADRYLEKMINNLGTTSISTLLLDLRQQTLQSGPDPRGLGDLNNAANLLRQQADYMALRGILALEHGDTVAAARHLARVLEMTFPKARCAASLSLLGARSPLDQTVLLAREVRPGAGSELNFGSRGVALHYLRLLHQAGSK